MSIIEEIQRYLGYTGPMDIETLNQTKKKLHAMRSAVKGRSAYRAFEIQSISDDQVILEGCDLRLTGKSIADHLKNSHKVYLMAATLGQEADRMIQAELLRSPSEGMIADAVASALIEEVCDACESEIIQDLRGEGHLTFRFSPGYGDLDLSLHPDILKVLNAHKKIGLTSNESHLLLPMKSVVAVIGVQKVPNHVERKNGCSLDNCDDCPFATDCQYRE